MQFTVRIPKPVLIAIGAVLSVAAGIAVARLLPTAYQGRISYGAEQPWQAVHAPTSATAYVVVAAIALVLYLDAVATTVLTRPRRRRAAHTMTARRLRVLQALGPRTSWI